MESDLLLAGCATDAAPESFVLEFGTSPPIASRNSENDDAAELVSATLAGELCPEVEVAGCRFANTG
jgi:hypothetical protein